MALPPFKKAKKAKPVVSKSDPMPRRTPGSAKKNSNFQAERQPFKQTATDMSPRMARVVRGS